MDVQVGSSVSASRLAAAECGRAQLNNVELALVIDFYKRRLAVIREREVSGEVEEAVFSLGQ